MNTEAIFVQKVNTSGPDYHHLFETFRDEILLPDVETGAGTDANSLLTFSSLNETQSQDLEMPSATQQMTPEDRLFLFDFDLNPTEKPEEINLAGIAQLPITTDDQIQAIRQGCSIPACAPPKLRTTQVPSKTGSTS